MKHCVLCHITSQTWDSAIGIAVDGIFDGVGRGGGSFAIPAKALIKNPKQENVLLMEVFLLPWVF